MKNTNPNNATDKHCSNCKNDVKDEILYDGKCEHCYDNEYSGCYGGGCIGGEK